MFRALMFIAALAAAAPGSAALAQETEPAAPPARNAADFEPPTMTPSEISLNTTTLAPITPRGLCNTVARTAYGAYAWVRGRAQGEVEAAADEWSPCGSVVAAADPVRGFAVIEGEDIVSLSYLSALLRPEVQDGRAQPIFSGENALEGALLMENGGAADAEGALAMSDDSGGAVLSVDIPRQNLRAGDYTGAARLRVIREVDDRDPISTIVSAPLKVQVKHHFFWPLAALICGFLIGVPLTRYREGQLGVDQCRLDIDRLVVIAESLGVREGDASHTSFWADVEDARACLLEDRVDDARTEIGKARDWLTEYRAKRREAMARAGMEADAAGLDPASIRTRSRQSRRRFNRYMVVSYLASIGFVAAFGFHSMYGQNPTFGMNAFTEYMGLFLIGFGAQPTTEAVGRLVSTWNLPGMGSLGAPKGAGKPGAG